MMIKRELYFEKIKPFINKKIIKVITGIRRCGKSSFLEQIYDYLLSIKIKKNHIIFINLEILSNKAYLDFEYVYKYITDFSKAVKNRIYLFIDEIQLMDQWEKLVASLLAEIDCDIYISGSNSKLLSGELATRIAGRYIHFELHPFNFNEFIEIRKSLNDIRENDNNYFEDYLHYGGFPGIHHFELQDSEIYAYLNDIYASIAIKDILQRTTINKNHLEKIMLFIFDNIGNIFSANNVVNFLKTKEKYLIGNETINNLLYAIKNSFIVSETSRINLKGKQILSTLQKYYVADIGMRNAIVGFNLNDVSKLIENLVYHELICKDYKVYVGKYDDKEIDFVATKLNNTIYIQVCYQLSTPSVQDREFKVLKILKDSFPKYVLSLDINKRINTEGIIHMNLIDFIMELK